MAAGRSSSTIRTLERGHGGRTASPPPLTPPRLKVAMVPELVAWVAEQRGLSLPEAGQVERQLEHYGLLR